MTMKSSIITVAIVTGLALTACGEQDAGTAEEPTETATSESSPTETPTETTPAEEPKGPDCAEVWVAGQDLPQNYAGCQDAEKEKWVQAMIYRCSSGQRLVTFGRTFYAAKGEVVNESQTPLARNPEFQKVLASCGA